MNNKFDIEKNLEHLFSEEEKQFFLPNTSEIMKSTSKYVEYSKIEYKKRKKQFCLLAVSLMCFVLIFSFVIHNYNFLEPSPTSPPSSPSNFFVYPEWVNSFSYYIIFSPSKVTEEKISMVNKNHSYVEYTAIECEIIFQWFQTLAGTSLTNTKLPTPKDKIYFPSKSVEEIMKYDTMLIAKQRDYSNERPLCKTDSKDLAEFIPYVNGHAQIDFDLSKTESFKDIFTFNSAIQEMKKTINSSQDFSTIFYAKAYPSAPLSNGMSVSETIDFFSNITTAQNLYHAFLQQRNNFYEKKEIIP